MKKLYGTPTANDAKNSLTDSQRRRGALTADIVEAGEGKGQLNPDWVEALMGYPQGWTDIEKRRTRTRIIREPGWMGHGKTAYPALHP